MTVREAIIDLEQYRIGVRMYGSLQYQLFYREDSMSMGTSRLIDTLDECIDVAIDMRAQRDIEQAGDNSFIKAA